MGQKTTTIIFINQSSGYLMIDIIKAYEGVYDERVLLAGVVNARNHKLPDEVKHHHIIEYDRSSKNKRILTWFIAFIQIIWIIKTKYNNSFLFIVSNPPLSSFIPFFCKNPFSLLIYDVYPEAITQLYSKNKSSLLIKLWKGANKNIFNKATSIVTISEGMRNLLQQYCDLSKVKVIPIWTDNNFFIKVPKEKNFFLKEQGLNHRFVVLYSGNLGYSHDVEFIIELAKKITDNDIFFLIIGSGEKSILIKNSIVSNRLSNCRILPLQPTHILPYSFSSADLAIITLSHSASLLSVPSKTYNFLSVGSPLLCVSKKDSELARLVSFYNVGQCFSTFDIDKMSVYILKLKNNPQYHTLLKNNAFNASLQFTPYNALRFLTNV